ncbi:cytochrome c oxidase subunit 1 [Ceratobasidium sp. 395]|nr:cytochrome c oxidase subunit 1 [Ceratobasidium sp. 395]
MNLEGCHIDAEDIVELLRESGDYHDHNIRVLADIPSLPASQQPTKQNILDGIEWLVDGCRSEDFRFFYYAGHGVQVQDHNGDEVDGLDEAIVPSDWSTKYGSKDDGLIIDDYLREHLVDSLPQGATLMASLDIHGPVYLLILGTILDMDHEKKRWSIGAQEPKYFYQNIKANVICWTACTESQVAWQTLGYGPERGRMTEAFTRYIRATKGISYLTLGIAILHEMHLEPLRPQNPQVIDLFQLSSPEARPRLIYVILLGNLQQLKLWTSAVMWTEGHSPIEMGVTL